jgi:hypothetical protein
MSFDTGETFQTIVARFDDRRAPAIIHGLRSGGHLLRHARMKDYYLQMPDDRHKDHNASISRGWVRRMLRNGLLVDYGIDRYALNPDLPPEKHSEDAQLSLALEFE